MELLNFDLGGAVLGMLPEDCARLAQLLDLACNHLISVEEEPLRRMAEVYQALFRSCAVAGMVPSHTAPDHFRDFQEDLAAIGMEGVLLLCALQRDHYEAGEDRRRYIYKADEANRRDQTE